MAFLAHDVGLLLFTICGLAHVAAQAPLFRRLHAPAGRCVLSVACPTLIVSGFVLCACHDKDDAIVFAAYGTVFATTWARQVLTTRLLHGLSSNAVLVREPTRAMRMCLNLAWGSALRCLNGALSTWTLVHCAASAGRRAWHADLCWALILLPWIAVRGPPAKRLGTTKRAWRAHHRRAGRTLWYLGVLGTIFSFTHDPYPLRNPLLRWAALTAPHALFLATQK